jgi:GNAT superfamily N-acetyltransferase
MIFERDRLAVGKARYSLQNSGAFKEEEHPRADDGKFGKGGGGDSNTSAGKEKFTENMNIEIADDGLSVMSGDSFVKVGFDDTGFHEEQDPETGEMNEVYDEFYKLDHVFVEPSKRGKGLAKKMIKESVANIIKKDPEARIVLAALPEADKAIDQQGLVDLYQSLGFRVSLNQEGSEAVIMQYEGSRKTNSSPTIRVYRASR